MSAAPPHQGNTPKTITRIPKATRPKVLTNSPTNNNQTTTGGSSCTASTLSTSTRISATPRKATREAPNIHANFQRCLSRTARTAMAAIAAIAPNTRKRKNTFSPR